MKPKQKSSLHYRVPEHGGTITDQSPRRRRIGLAVLVAVIAGVAVAVHVISAPVHGHKIVAGVIKPRTATKAAAPVLPPSIVQSQYFQLHLPAGYAAQTASQAGAVLYQQTLTKPSSQGSLIIALTVLNLPGSSLNNNSSYTAEVQQPTVYHFTSQKVGSDTVQIANDTRSGSVVAFWPHGGYLGTIGISSGIDNPNGDDADELAALRPLLAAWQWR